MNIVDLFETLLSDNEKVNLDIVSKEEALEAVSDMTC